MSSNNLNALISHLKAKRTGTGWMACCPAHDDKHPSLSISERNGKVLVHCFAGCSQKDVIDSLKSLGLWGHYGKK